MSETMTAEQAAFKLTNIMHDDHYAWHPSILEAFGMAVDALKGAEGDCISRADVNRVLEDWFRTVFGADSFRKTGLCRELRDLPSAQPEQRWIPCSERLPEEDGNYWVTVDPDYVPSGYQSVDVITWLDGKWIMADYFVLDGENRKKPDYKVVDFLQPIIAWMPLPEPWKEGEAE